MVLQLPVLPGKHHDSGGTSGDVLSQYVFHRHRDDAVGHSPMSAEDPFHALGNFPRHVADDISGHGFNLKVRQSDGEGIAQYTVRVSTILSPTVHQDLAAALEGKFLKYQQLNTYTFVGNRDTVAAVSKISGIISVLLVESDKKVINSHLLS